LRAYRKDERVRMTQWAWLFLCALARLMPLALLWPGTAARVVSLRIRIALSLVLALWIASLFADSSGRLPGRLPDAGVVIGYELLLGLGLALGLQVLLVGVQLAGSLVSQLAGFVVERPGGSGGGLGRDVDGSVSGLADAGRATGHAGAPSSDRGAVDLFSGGTAGHAPAGRRCAPLLAELLTRSFQSRIPPGGSHRLCFAAGHAGHGAAGTLHPATQLHRPGAEYQPGRVAGDGLSVAGCGGLAVRTALDRWIARADTVLASLSRAGVVQRHE